MQFIFQYKVPESIRIEATELKRRSIQLNCDSKRARIKENQSMANKLDFESNDPNTPTSDAFLSICTDQSINETGLKSFSGIDDISEKLATILHDYETLKIEDSNLCTILEKQIHHPLYSYIGATKNLHKKLLALENENSSLRQQNEEMNKPQSTHSNPEVHSASKIIDLNRATRVLVRLKPVNNLIGIVKTARISRYVDVDTTIYDRGTFFKF